MEKELYCNNQMTTQQMERFEYNNKIDLIFSSITFPFGMLVFGFLLYVWLKDRKWWMSVCFLIMFFAILELFCLSVIWLVKINQNPYDYFCVYLS